MISFQILLLGSKCTCVSVWHAGDQPPLHCLGEQPSPKGCIGGKPTQPNILFSLSLFLIEYEERVGPWISSCVLTAVPQVPVKAAPPTWLLRQPRSDSCPCAILPQPPLPHWYGFLPASGKHPVNTMFFLGTFPGPGKDRIMMAYLHTHAFSGVRRFQELVPSVLGSLCFILTTVKWKVINGNCTSNWATHGGC